MAAEPDPHARPVCDRIHPAVYKVVLALGIWLVLSIWGFFGKGYTDLALAVATTFIGIALALPIILWLATRKARAGSDDGPSSGESFSQWLAGDVDTHRCRLKGSEALIEVLLPIMAVSFGMSLFALILHFDVAGMT